MPSFCTLGKAIDGVDMDIAGLRATLRPIVGELKDACTHDTLDAMCAELAMPIPVNAGSKRDRLFASFDEMLDEHVPATAERLLKRGLRDPATRNRIQDLLWADNGCPSIPKRFRREVARAMERVELYGDARHFDELLELLWVIETDPFASLIGREETGLAGLIQQHVHRNPGDWSVEQLFDELGVYEATDQRFALFLEGLADADVRPDIEDQRRFVDCVNEPLRGCGVELRQTGLAGGYPSFSVVSLHNARGRPKNLIFASEKKPDIRFRDAIDNDIEIASDADKVLVYDRPIGQEGLRWQDLQDWWSESRGVSDGVEAKKQLYKRLKASMPENSPPQMVLFESFYKGFGAAAPKLPALLPEVWLHWDPQTVRERGKNALLRFRMDFLLLLSHGVRVVIEVDGKHHYADGTTGMADPARYAAMVSADRDLKLAGYEVFRFGAAELRSETSQNEVHAFFVALFRRFKVLP